MTGRGQAMAGSKIANLLMLAGAAVWLAGEIIGITLDAVHRAHGVDTTSGWVWAAEHRWHWIRMLVAAGLAGLAVHFLQGG